MNSPRIDLSKLKRGSQQLAAALDRIRRMDVLVGIPQAASSRKKGTVTNAELMYIHTHGSRLRNIPARPVIEPAIAADGNKQIIAKELKDAAAAHLGGDTPKALTSLKRAGQAGVNASKAWFVDPRNNWPPNSPKTIKRKGSDRPLIDTGALRRALTYVVRDGDASTDPANPLNESRADRIKGELLDVAENIADTIGEGIADVL